MTEFEQALSDYERALKVFEHLSYPEQIDYQPDLMRLRASLIAMATRGAVPREPTKAMIEASLAEQQRGNHESWGKFISRHWRAMYDATQPNPHAEER